MVITQSRREPGASAAPASRAAERDPAVDLARAGCVLAVVTLHALMVGVSVREGHAVFENASEGAWWIVPVSWTLQVMPLFFVIGGFSAATAYRRARGRGMTGAEYAAGRVRRLLLPAVCTIAAVGAALAAMSWAGVPGDLLAVAGYRYGQPLWFLAVFLGCQALVPLVLAWHERAPRRALIALASAAIAIDLWRETSGVEAIGCLNLAFVWLVLQQLGFVLADGTVDALPRRTRAAAAAGAVALLALTVAAGIHSADLVAALNPPTTALLLVGVAHTALFSLLRARLRMWSASRGLAVFSRFVNRRAMTVYLWHMPVLLAMAGTTALLSLGTGAALPVPGGAMWWATRPGWLGVAFVLTGGIALLLAPLESRPFGPATLSPGRVAGSVLVGLAALVLLLTVAATPMSAAAAALLLSAALRLTGDGSSRRPSISPGRALRRAPVAVPGRRR